MARQLFGLTPDEYRMYVAVHELGHAVAGITAGHDYRKIELRIGDDGHPADGIAVARRWGRKERFPLLVAIHGGFIASEMHFRKIGLWDRHRQELAASGARHDHDQATRLKPSPQESAEAISQARTHLKRHWTVIDYATPQLLAKGRLSYRQLRSVPGW
ncbi:MULTISPECIES: hypothetical protein [Streptomyces]|uniref:hypothetical protein n=1 Tax=Streptomyces TaxID=1883 RepID=UPI002F26160B